MKRLGRYSWRLWFVLALLLVGLFLIPKVWWPVYGWLKGEAFYEGMPTSWWAQELEEVFQPLEVFGPNSVRTVWLRSPPPSLGDRVRDWLKLPPSRGGFFERSGLDPTDPKALPVILELMKNPSPNVRCIVMDYLIVQGKRQPEAVVPALLEACHDADRDVRLDAIDALQQVDREAAARAGFTNE